MDTSRILVSQSCSTFVVFDLLATDTDHKQESLLERKARISSIIEPSSYVPGIRSTNWLKIKNWREIDTVILGYRTQPRFRLIVGLHFPNVDNKPVATVEFEFSPGEKAAFLAS